MKFWFFLSVVGAGLNISDAILTTYAIDARLATESNPLMALLLSVSVPMFWAAKVFVAALFIIVGLNCHRPIARVGLGLSLLAYLLIVFQHLLGLFA